ncbi:hypothetical protein F4781DRAFT_435518 [Annulohypoxylon bovei var. microspora]|nr:hypothetical protein F4781DRAFT_435518 [Annulohypoxylon bovei var. microspora]
MAYTQKAVVLIDSLFSLLGIKVDDPYIGFWKTSDQVGSVLGHLDYTEQASLRVEHGALRHLPQQARRGLLTPLMNAPGLGGVGVGTGNLNLMSIFRPATALSTS